MPQRATLSLSLSSQESRPEKHKENRVEENGKRNTVYPVNPSNAEATFVEAQGCKDF